MLLLGVAAAALAFLCGRAASTHLSAFALLLLVVLSYGPGNGPLGWLFSVAGGIRSTPARAREVLLAGSRPATEPGQPHGDGGRLTPPLREKRASAQDRCFPCKAALLKW